MTTEHKVGRHYQGELGGDYFAYQDETADAQAAAIDDFKYAPYIQAGDAVVDFGCGQGHMLARVTAASRIGIEPNEHARRAAARNGIEVVAGTEDLADACADVVVSHHALEHTLSPYEELVHLRRLLRPGGTLVLWLPLDDWRARRERHPGYDLNHHLYGWTPLHLRNLLVEAGYKPREVRVVTHGWPPGHRYLVRLPAKPFNAIAWTWAVVRHRRQLLAVATVT